MALEIFSGAGWVAKSFQEVGERASGSQEFLDEACNKQSPQPGIQGPHTRWRTTKWKKIYVPPRASSSSYSKHCVYVKEGYATLAIPAVIWCGLRSPCTNAPEKPHGLTTLVGDPRLNFDFCMIS